MTTKLLKIALALLAMALPLALPAQAQTDRTTRVTGTITRIMAKADDIYGGCAAGLSASLADAGFSRCNDNWVTFSCVGEHATKSSAMRMLDVAQLAFVTGKRVSVYIDESKTHNGFCFVSRIDVLSN